MISAFFFLVLMAILWPNFLKRSLKVAAIGTSCIVVLIAVIIAAAPTPKTGAGAVATVPADTRGEGVREAEAFNYAIAEAGKIPAPVQHFSQETYDAFLKIDTDEKKFGDCVANQIKAHGWLAHGTQRNIWATYKGYGEKCFDII